MSSMCSPSRRLSMLALSRHQPKNVVLTSWDRCVQIGPAVTLKACGMRLVWNLSQTPKVQVSNQLRTSETLPLTPSGPGPSAPDRNAADPPPPRSPLPGQANISAVGHERKNGSVPRLSSDLLNSKFLAPTPPHNAIRPSAHTVSPPPRAAPRREGDISSTRRMRRGGLERCPNLDPGVRGSGEDGQTGKPKLVSGHGTAFDPPLPEPSTPP
ncbi:uncharacterized protein B0H64DRAFT_194783 [Chaetomium fimeti]|uniref:Uncharacterized protein n=1 Tax=Chaetomium fimeti TaxID=1854472 RepID=A0AAE0LRG2_9PEZI|nr:hypothetical protein B0H64DRAFT_194783 [Chaetomium fimeti]